MATAEVTRWSDALLEVLEPEGLVVKRVGKRPSEHSSRVYAGQLAKEPLAIREGDATFLCDLDDGLATGVYLDLSHARLRAKGLSQGGEVLNLFAYTSTFSVQAALGGATRVTSVDTSRRALRRGRANMAASGLDSDAHRWFADDVLEHLGRAGRRKDRYQLVVVDPPAYGRSGRRQFVFERDLDELVQGSLALLADGGSMVLTSHVTTLGVDRLRRSVDRAADVLKMHTSKAEVMEPPWDCPMGDPGSGGENVGVLVLRFDSK